MTFYEPLPGAFTSMIVIDQPETESIHFPTRELQLSATQSTFEYFNNFKMISLLPLVVVVVLLLLWKQLMIQFELYPESLL